ncbi:hypothetical protein D1007_45992 [Hordeum vulgare]|nr:hypothetical protein D1007_45992 [Hordeum vulgare]
MRIHKKHTHRSLDGFFIEEHTHTYGNCKPPVKAASASPPTMESRKVTSGEESLLFSLEFEHNGIFIGEGVNSSYLYIMYATFDYCHGDTWSLSMVKYCLDKLDYSHGFPSLQVYWCLPGKEIVDGLVCVDSEEVISCSEETDSDFDESDYDVEDMGDDIFTENIDAEVGDNNEQEGYIPEDDLLYDDDLNLSKAELEKLNYTFRSYNREVDMNNPVLRVGLVFGEMKELGMALDAYTLRNQVQISKARNESEKLNVVCFQGCPWLLKASKDNRTGSIIIR